ncbi:MAG: YCF48-related protein, partial [Verrucomicrobiota bacterium]
RMAVETLAKHWKWVERDPALIEMLEGAGDQAKTNVIERIRRIVLDAPDFTETDDHAFFKGIGHPPAPAADATNPQRRSMGDLLGTLELADGVVTQPPLIRDIALRRFRCSQWVSIGPVPDSSFAGIGRVSQIAIHPTNGHVLIAGAAGGGVWKTTNGGASWRPTMNLEPTLTIGAVAIAPSDPKIMYAASGEDGGAFSPSWSGVGIYRSSDSGNRWSLMTGVPSTRFSAIVVHPQRADTIYVAGNRGLHKSIDGGATWRTNPGQSSLFDGRITDVVIGFQPRLIRNMPELDIDIDIGDLRPPFFLAERVYIGVQNSGVFRSTNAGEQFGSNPAFTRLDASDQLPSGAAAGWIKLAIGRNGPNRTRFLAAKLGPNGSRIFTTTDGGDTWDEKASNVATASFDAWCSVIAVDPNDEDILYAGASTELKRTTNGGASASDWTSINTDVHPDQQDIAFDPDDSSRVFLGNDGGVYRTENRGTDWTLAAGRLAITQFYDIDISEKDRDVVAGGAQDNGIYYRNTSGVWRNITWGDG